MKEEEKKYYLFEMNLKWLNIVSIVLIVFLILFTTWIGIDLNFSGDAWTITLILIVSYLILHELFHGASYVLNGAHLKNITFGAHLEKGILCCLCKQNVSRKNILISVITPFVWLGFVTYMIGVATDNLVLILLSIFNISGCSGDLMMFLAFLKLKDFEYSEYDNPTAFGLYSETDLGHEKLLGLNYIGTKEELEKNDLKKVTISKTSIVAFFALLAFILFCYMMK